MIPVWLAILLTILAVIGAGTILALIWNWFDERRMEREEETRRRYEHLKRHSELRQEIWELGGRIATLERKLKETQDGHDFDCGCMEKRADSGDSSPGGGVRKEGQGGLSSAPL